jgi:predicted anti-sigma-YlaC factor YlaD
MRDLDLVLEGSIWGRASLCGMLLLVVALSLGTGCSIKRLAVDRLGNALAAGGETFAGDDDPELIRQAVPFSLKLMESLLAESPRHQGLLLACARGFTQYAFAFVEQEADETEERDLDRTMEMRGRARRLYLRARGYGLRGLDSRYPGLEKKLRHEPRAAVRVLRPADVPLAYWTAVAWAAAVAVTKDSADLIADLPIVEALIDRALALDETFDYGAIHSFLITYEMSRQAGAGDPEERARKHFQRALELSGSKLCGPLVALAEAVSVARQDKAEFEKLLRQALEIKPDARPEWQLANLVMQRRARWLLGRVDRLFVD